MTSSVSTATASDLPDLAKLMAQSAHDPLSIDQLLDELARPQVPMLACRDDEGLLVGYTFYRVVAEPRRCGAHTAKAPRENHGCITNTVPR